MRKSLARRLRSLANRLDDGKVTIHMSPMPSEDVKAYARKIAEVRRYNKGGVIQ